MLPHPSQPRHLLPFIAADLATGARTAEPAVQEAYLTALRGALLSAGDRLTPDTVAKVGALRLLLATGRDACLLPSCAVHN
jgi:hypothetical protein